MRLEEVGVTTEAARAVAVQLFCLIEGAFLLARVAPDREAMTMAGAAGAALVAAALPARGKKITTSI